MAIVRRINTKKHLFEDVTRLIEDSRSFVATTINASLTMLYWKIGARINDEILNNKRADYGKQIVATLSQQLEKSHGKGFGSFKKINKKSRIFRISVLYSCEG